MSVPIPDGPPAGPRRDPHAVDGPGCAPDPPPGSAAGSGGDPAGVPRRTAGLRAAALTRGPAELLDFLVPLWAGPTLGASPSVVGQLVAVELAVSVVARPLVGRLADAAERRTLAATGALLYGVSCVGFAWSTAARSTGLAFGAAVLAGLGGSLLWVSLRSMVAEGHAADGLTFARLLRAEETGSWIAFVAGLSLLTALGFSGVFVLCAASCLLAAVLLLRVPRRPRAPVPREGGGAVSRRLRPWLLTTAVVATGEGAIGLVLLLHLQRGLGLGVVETAYVFLPGAVAMAVLPPVLHGVVLRTGRRAALVVAGLLSAAFAVALAFSTSPWTIAAWWLLSGIAWAVVVPLEQAVLAEASPHRLGQAMGAYEAALLLGGALGATVAGWSYEQGSWVTTCLVAAGIVLLGAVLGPWALRRTGVADRPGAHPGGGA